MIHPELAELLRHRLELIADHDFRDRDPDGQLAALQSVSEDISRWHEGHRGHLHPRLEHFLSGCSFDKALRFIESDGSWSGH
ncbi:hypothetical protein HAHE_41810 [Haloferula helveola]|uniref:Uncharacterized protein n=1 Tax=Haloferula helveola TaxID=490095 RepID=A0ABN6HFJ6_9BACT|nr:hypothetical protein HAHE_41810 [Haloferula helveola]